MSGWPLVKLGEICDLYQPETISRKQLNQDGQYVVYGANGPIGSYDRFNHEESEVTMTCRGATCGRINVTPPKVWITGNAMVIRPKSEAISKEFLASVLPHLDLSQTISGTAQPQITRKSLSPLLVPVPPLDEQKRIVAKLDKIQMEVGHMLSNLYERLQAVNRLRGAALANRLKGTNSAVTPSSTQDHLGTEWPLVRLGELVSLEYGKPLPPEKRNAGGAHPVYGANGVKTLTDEYLVEGDSIVVGRKGSAGEITRVSGRWWPLDVTYYVLVKADGLDMGYLFLVLMGLNLPSLARGVKPGINRNDVYDLRIPLPDLAEQKRIVADLDGLAVELDDLEAKLIAQKSLVSAFQIAALSAALAGGV